MKKAGLLKGNPGSNIVVLVPQHITRLTPLAEVYIESGAGKAAGFEDHEYEAAGARIVNSAYEVTESCDLILCYGELPKKMKPYRHHTVVSFLNVLYDFSPLTTLVGEQVDLFCLELMPRSTIAQSMDILSSVAAVSGYQAMITAAGISPVSVPMMTSAGGTLRPAKVLVLGSGVAGLQAIATAKRLGAVVRAFDVRKASKTEVESLGAEFIDIDGAAENKQAGGYAVEQSPDYQEKIETILHTEALNADIIITTAKIPGKNAPLLLKAHTVEQMKPGSVIVDLAAETGGNCALTQKDKVIHHRGVTIVGYASLAEHCAKSASILLSGNYCNFVTHLIRHFENGTEDEILTETRVLKNGTISHEKLLQTINTY